MDKILEGKVAIVTGSGQGIGRGIARYFASQGAKVITNNRKPGSGFLANFTKDDMPPEDWDEMVKLAGDAQDTADIIRQEGGEAYPFFADVSDAMAAQSMVDFAVEKFGHLDIVVNNAAGLGGGPIENITDDQWNFHMSSKMKGTFNLMRSATPVMKEQKYGRFINASSEAWLGQIGESAYSAANAGIVGLTWAASKELWRFGITANVYCPQGQSPAHAVEYNAMLRKIKAMTGKDPDPRILAAVERDHADARGLAPALAFLASEDGGYVSGAVFATYSSGTVKFFSDPAVKATIKRSEEEGPWTQAEIKEAFKNDLLGEDYVSPASVSQWG